MPLVGDELEPPLQETVQGLLKEPKMPHPLATSFPGCENAHLKGCSHPWILNSLIHSNSNMAATQMPTERGGMEARGS